MQVEKKDRLPPSHFLDPVEEPVLGGITDANIGRSIFARSRRLTVYCIRTINHLCQITLHFAQLQPNNILFPLRRVKALKKQKTKQNRSATPFLFGSDVFISTYTILLECCESVSTSKVESRSDTFSNRVRNEIMVNDRMNLSSSEKLLSKLFSGMMMKGKVLNGVEIMMTSQARNIE